MLKLSDEVREELGRAVQAAAGRGEVRAAVEEIYRRLAIDTDLRKPRCDASGRCCRFEEYGHRLFVTTMELAAFVGARLAAPSPGLETETQASPLQVLSSGCPYQVDGLCSVHSIRPFGCRIFFCDPTSQGWQSERYELFHAELKRLHEALGVAYFYVEWREALRALGLGGEAVLSRT